METFKFYENLSYPFSKCIWSMLLVMEVFNFCYFLRQQLNLYCAEPCLSQANSVNIMHGCWCPGSSSHHIIISHYTDYVKWECLCLPWAWISTTYNVRAWRNYRKCKWISMLPRNNHGYNGSTLVEPKMELFTWQCGQSATAMKLLA